MNAFNALCSKVRLYGFRSTLTKVDIKVTLSYYVCCCNRNKISMSELFSNLKEFYELPVDGLRTRKCNRFGGHQFIRRR